VTDARIFISYRTSDGADKATTLARDLGEVFGDAQVFLDKEDLPAGRPWRAAIDAALGQQPVLLVLVTPDTFGGRNAAGALRIDDADDPVRREVDAALKAAKPDLVFSSLLFADLPIFMRTAHGAGLMDGGTKFVFPAAGFQHTGLKKSFTPEGMIFGHNTLYFDYEKGSPLQKDFVKDYIAKYKDYPHWEADRAYFAMQVYKAGVEAAYKAKKSWPGKEDVINAIEGVKVESLGGPGHMRKDHIPEQTFYQGITTHKNRYDFPTLANPVDVMYSDQLQKPTGMDFWKWIETATIKL